MAPCFALRFVALSWQAFDEHHAPEAAAELMCSWAYGSSKLLRPLSRIIVQGVDTTTFSELDSWLLAMKKWLELDDLLQVRATRTVQVRCDASWGYLILGGREGWRGVIATSHILVVWLCGSVELSWPGWG